MVASVVRPTASARVDLRGYLAECQALTIEEIRRIVRTGDASARSFYDLMLDYPMRAAKGLRPALCMATCRALGGGLEACLPSAAVLELYHNAFLIHDDVEDGSEQRRDRDTLHRTHGSPIAINVGDGMLALAFTPLLDNTRVIGLGKALRIVQIVAKMARETAEGQAMELDWISRSSWSPSDDDYREMVVKKTGWYSFITPMQVGATIAGARPEQMEALGDAARELSIAFQIRDDVLNLRTGRSAYGKEVNGDLWEGKRTLILLHALRNLKGSERRAAEKILARPRTSRCGALLVELELAGELTGAGRARLEAELGGSRGKTAADIAQLLGWIERSSSLDYATEIGREHAQKARLALARADLPHSLHRDVIERLIDFTVEREH